MKSKLIRISTIILFSCLIAVFVAYRSGYFSSEGPPDVPEYILSDSPFKELNTPLLNREDSLQGILNYQLRNVIASSSKSIVAADESGLAKNLKISLTKDWRKAFGFTDDLNKDSVLISDSVSMGMARKIDSLSNARFMLMVSSKSLVGADQTHLADSLMHIIEKALSLRIDSLKKKDNPR